MPKIIRTDKWGLFPTKSQLSVLVDTVEIYREYVRRLISIVNLRWKEVATTDAQQRYVEQLFHKTKDNPCPKYAQFFGLGTRLYKFPSYLRRAAINDAIGHVSSFHTRYRDWQRGRRKRKTASPPTLNTTCGVYPDLYKNQCIKLDSELKTARIKVYKDRDWQWEGIEITSIGRRHLISGVKQLSPTLVVRNNRASLSVPYQMPKVSKEQTSRYCGVDLGINTTAVCSVINEAGEVKARQFIHNGKALDKRDKHLAAIRRKARLTKNLHKGFAKAHYRKAANINKNLANQAAKQITNFAIANGATAVVVENLRHWEPRGGKKKSSLKQRFHGWVKSAIVDRLEHLGLELGIEIVSVNARGTSSQAYDGTGEVKRDKGNYSMGTFPTSKRYAVDLSASYNIAARYIAYKLKLASKSGKLFSSQSCGMQSRPVPELGSGTGRDSGGKPRSWATLSSLWGREKPRLQPVRV